MKSRKTKILLSGLLVLILLLDWAALDDITTGNEPSFFLEYLIVIVSIPILIFIGYYFLYTLKPSKK